jgi:TonB family protein
VVIMKLRPAVLLLAAFVLGPRPGLAQDAPPKVAGVDVPAPKRTKSVHPHYPPEAQALGMRGIVILELLVGPEGKVVSARVTRSVPPFDDAALSAAREWEYEVTKVEGKPVSVILTVPIEFKIRLPEMAREDGIPELRQGVVPAFPAGAGPETATVTAEVTLEPDGHVAEARIKSGESPWAESVIQALRTWRFSPVDGPGGLAFEVKAEFASGGKTGPHVNLRLSGPRRTEAPPSAEASPAPSTPGATASPAPTGEASPPLSPAPVASPRPRATPSPAGETPPPPPAPRASPSPAAARPAAPPVEMIRNPAGGKPASPPAAPPSPAGTPPATGTPPGSRTAPAAASAGPAATASPALPTPSISAVRDVTLASGVPDLMKGRRPVTPPLARMQGISGTVDVHFAVDAAGTSTVREVAGPDPLKEAARQTVTSWSFRRSTPERLFLAATFTYKGDTASAAVRSQE